MKARTERERRPEGVELADAFCQQARLRAEALFDRLWENTDSVDAAVAKRVTAGRYAFLEEGVIPPPPTGDWVAHWEPGPSQTPDVRRRIPKRT
jgi:hypothetical protein